MLERGSLRQLPLDIVKRNVEVFVDHAVRGGVGNFDCWCLHNGSNIAITAERCKQKRRKKQRLRTLCVIGIMRARGSPGPTTLSGCGGYALYRTTPLGTNNLPL